MRAAKYAFAHEIMWRSFKLKTIVVRIVIVVLVLQPAILTFTAIDEDMKDQLIAGVAIISAIASFGEGFTQWQSQADAHHNAYVEFNVLAQACGVSVDGQRGYTEKIPSVEDLNGIINRSPRLHDEVKKKGEAEAKKRLSYLIEA